MVRYELKFSFSEDKYDYILKAINSHPAMFSEIFQQRQINNIYFDSIDLQNYKANIYGLGNREKYRIRWYDNIFGLVNFPKLEIKRKYGLVGDKLIFSLPSFKFENSFSWNKISTCINYFFNNSKSEIENQMYLKNFLTQKPIVINNYQRRYFLSRDKKIRLTIDTKINYRAIATSFVEPICFQDRQIIVELKFDKEYFFDAEKVTSFFNWRLSRNSKYVNSVNLLLAFIPN